MRQGRDAGRPIEHPRAWSAVLLACCALIPCVAAAQASGSVGVVSDYRYRGHSLSDGDPALQASVAWDAGSGAYGGLFASTTRTAASTGVQWVPYAGIARRDAQGRSWDIGVRYTHFEEDAYDFVEAHVGIAFRRIAVRLHLAPDYYGAVRNAYLEADAHVPLGDRVRLLLHGGVARSGAGTRVVYLGRYEYGHRRGEYARSEIDRTRFDLSAGIAIRTALCDVQATWHYLDGEDRDTYAATPWNPNDRSGFVLGCVKRW